MYRTSKNKPLLMTVDSVGTFSVQRGPEPLKDEKIKLIQLLSSYIKGTEERDKIYTELEKLKKSIS
jgi:hypothetical protein